MVKFMRTLIPSAKKDFDPFTYRILCDGKLVDFSPTYEGIMKKYKRYAQDCLDGYSDRVSVLRVHPDTNEEYVMFTYYRRDEPYKNLSRTLQEPYKKVGFE